MSVSSADQEISPEAGQKTQQEPQGEKTPLGQKVAWSIGAIPDQIITNGVSNLALPIYNKSLGMDPILINYALAIPRIFIAIIGPYIANYSDRTVTRWGRRRPFIFVGGLLISILFVVLWMPPSFLIGPSMTFHIPTWFPWLSGQDKTIPLLFIYFTVVYIIAYSSLALFGMRGPLSIEMCTDPHDRTVLYSMNTFFAYAISFALPWLYKLCFPAGRLLEHLFGKDATLAGKGFGLEVRGVGLVAMVAGLVSLVCAMAPLLCRERPPEDEASRSHLPLLKAFLMTFQNKPLIILFFAMLLVSSVGPLIGPLNFYISMDYICHGDKEYASTVGGWSGTIGGVLGLLMTTVIPPISRLLGKKNTMILGMAVAVVGFVSSWWLFTPKNPYLQLIVSAVITAGMAGVWVLSTSMMADICDYDEFKYGLRREGMFGAAYGVLMTILSSAVMMASGYVLYMAGYENIALQSAKSIFQLRVWFIVIAVFLLLISIFLIWLYPITEKRVREVRAILDARHRAQSETAR